MYHQIREFISDGKVYVSHVDTINQLADLLTKSHPPIRHQSLVRGIIQIYSAQQPTWYHTPKIYFVFHVINFVWTDHPNDFMYIIICFNIILYQQFIPLYPSYILSYSYPCCKPVPARQMNHNCATDEYKKTMFPQGRWNIPVLRMNYKDEFLQGRCSFLCYRWNIKECPQGRRKIPVLRMSITYGRRKIPAL